MTLALGRTLRGLAAFLALAVGLVSLRYLLPDIPGAAPNVMANPFAGWALPIHAGFGAAALILGPLQFVRGKTGQRARWHRVTGAFYMAACLISAPAGLVMAMGVTTGFVAALGFGLLAVAWLWTTASGLRAVLERRHPDHGRWMARSYALTFAAVTLRLYLPLANVLPVDGLDVYRAIAFLCWVPNLLAVELWLRLSFRPQAAAGR